MVTPFMNFNGKGSFPATVLQTLSLKISVLSKLDPDPVHPPVTIRNWQLNVTLKQ